MYTPVRDFINNQGSATTVFEEILKEMRLDTKFTDVVFVCDGGTVQAHRIVLSSMSPYFKTMFFSDFKEAKTRTIDLSHVNIEFFNILLDYIYLNSVVKINSGNISTVLRVHELSHLFDIKGLIAICWQVIKKSVTFHNYADIWNTFLTYGGQEDIADVVHVVLENLKEVMENTEQLQKLSINQINLLVTEIVKKCKLMEDFFLEGIIKWIKFKKVSAYESQCLLLGLKYDFISRQCMNTLLYNEHSVFTDKIVMEIFKQKVTPKIKRKVEMATKKTLTMPLVPAYRRFTLRIALQCGDINLYATYQGQNETHISLCTDYDEPPFISNENDSVLFQTNKLHLMLPLICKKVSVDIIDDKLFLVERGQMDSFVHVYSFKSQKWNLIHCVPANIVTMGSRTTIHFQSRNQQYEVICEGRVYHTLLLPKTTEDPIILTTSGLNLSLTNKNTKPVAAYIEDRLYIIESNDYNTIVHLYSFHQSSWKTINCQSYEIRGFFNNIPFTTTLHGNNLLSGESQPPIEMLKRIRSDSKTTDVVLVCSGDEVGAHRAFLCNRSPFFKRKLEESLQNRLQFLDIQIDIMNIVLDYIYFFSTENIPKTDISTVLKVYKASGLFELEGLVKFCWDILTKGVNIYNFVDIWNTFLAFGTDSRIDGIISFVLENLQYIIENSDKFLSLPLSNIEFLIDKISSSQNVKIEDFFLEELIKWYKVNKIQVEKVQELILKLNFGLISRECIEKLMKGEVSIFTDSMIRQLFQQHFMHIFKDKYGK